MSKRITKSEVISHYIKKTEKTLRECQEARERERGKKSLDKTKLEHLREKRGKTTLSMSRIENHIDE